MMLGFLSAAASAASSGPPAWLQFAPLVAMGGVLYFLMLRPQMRQQKDHKSKLEAIARGDNVVTGGGLLARVTKVDGDTLELELAPNIKVKALRSTISDVLDKGGRPAAND